MLSRGEFGHVGRHQHPYPQVAHNKHTFNAASFLLSRPSLVLYIHIKGRYRGKSFSNFCLSCWNRTRVVKLCCRNTQSNCSPLRCRSSNLSWKQRALHLSLSEQTDCQVEKSSWRFHVAQHLVISGRCSVLLLQSTWAGSLEVISDACQRSHSFLRTRNNPHRAPPVPTRLEMLSAPLSPEKRS